MRLNPEIQNAASRGQASEAEAQIETYLLFLKNIDPLAPLVRSSDAASFTETDDSFVCGEKLETLGSRKAPN